MCLNISEKSLFVEPESKPNTQRQLNLYNYFLFIKNILQSDRFKDVVEVGCGRGTMSLYLKKYLNKRVTLVDNSVEAIDLAKKEFFQHQLDANFHIGDASKLDIASDSFDASISVGLAEHLENVEALFGEQYRVLRSGGVMISLNFPKKVSIQILNDLMRLAKKILGQYNGSVRADYYRNSLAASDYKQIAESVGFKHVRAVNVCPFPIFTPITLLNDQRLTKFYRLILYLRSLFQSYPYKTNSLFAQGHLLIGVK
mgnify:CR=1 FL=1